MFVEKKSIPTTWSPPLLTAGICHDLQTILSRIRLATEMINTQDQDLAHAIIQDIATCQKLFSQCIDSLQGQRFLHLNKHDLNQMIREMVAIERGYGREIEQSLYPGELWLTIHALSLQRSLSNLLDNAIRYGHGWIKVSSGHYPKFTWFQIEDNGPGIACNTQQQLMQFFIQDNLQIGQCPAGLGLMVVKYALDIHQGQITFGRSKHHGLKIRVTLPADISHSKISA